MAVTTPPASIMGSRKVIINCCQGTFAPSATGKVYFVGNATVGRTLGFKCRIAQITGFAEVATAQGAGSLRLNVYKGSLSTLVYTAPIAITTAAPVSLAATGGTSVSTAGADILTDTDTIIVEQAYVNTSGATMIGTVNWQVELECDI